MWEPPKSTRKYMNATMFTVYTQKRVFSIVECVGGTRHSIHYKICELILFIKNVILSDSMLNVERHHPWTHILNVECINKTPVECNVQRTLRHLFHVKIMRKFNKILIFFSTLFSFLLHCQWHRANVISKRFDKRFWIRQSIITSKK